MSVIALAGNPNSGKSALFNRLTGLRQKVANYPGVTVERVSGRFKYSSREMTIIDLPGLYSLSEASEDTRIAFHALIGQIDEPIDCVAVVVDSTNLQRSLPLVLQIRDLGKPALLILNMEDELKARGGYIDYHRLEKEIGMPIFPVSAKQGWGLARLIAYLKQNDPPKAERKEKKSLEYHVAEAKRITAEVMGGKIQPHKWSDRIDGLLLHRFVGIGVFLVIFMLVFQAIFFWIEPFMTGIEVVLGGMVSLIERGFEESMFRQFLVEGIIAGVGSVLIFLPQIVVLFLLIGLMEFSGYMARASFVMDKVMEKVGLQGKSFLPLLSSCACAVPGIMATRTIESKRDRLVTIFIAPFMTCSARLPVYILLITAFIPNVRYLGGVVDLRTFTLIGLYLLGGLAAFGTAFLLGRGMKKTESLPFIQEIPPYRLPSAKALFFYVWSRAMVFIRKAGTIILGTTVILWLLASLPASAVKQNGVEGSYAGRIGKVMEPVIAPLGFDWKIGVGLIASLAAREVIVSTLATIYEIEHDEEDHFALRETLLVNMRLPQALSLLVFFVFALQCISTVAVARKETGNWLWPLFMFVYMSLMAYGASFLVYQITDTLLT